MKYTEVIAYIMGIIVMHSGYLVTILDLYNYDIILNPCIWFDALFDFKMKETHFKVAHHLILKS